MDIQACWTVTHIFRTAFTFQNNPYFIKDVFWSIGLPFSLFTSPIFANYGVSFLTNVPAICIVLAGWWQFLRFYNTKRNRLLYFSILLFMTAGLIKISTLISLIFLIAVFAGERIPCLIQD